MLLRLLNLEFLLHAGADLPGEVVEYLEKTSTVPAPPAYHRILERGRDNGRNTTILAECWMSPGKPYVEN